MLQPFKTNRLNLNAFSTFYNLLFILISLVSVLAPACAAMKLEDMRFGPNLSLWSMKLSFMFWPSDVEYRRSSDSVTSMFGGAPWDTLIVYDSVYGLYILYCTTCDIIDVDMCFVTVTGI